MNLLDPVMVQLDKLWATVRGMPAVRWATVTQTAPLRIQLDGETTPMLISPQTTVHNLRAGERVVCIEQNRRIIITARIGDDPVPFAPVSVFGPETASATGAAAAWQNVAGATITVTPKYETWVRLDFHASVRTTDPAVYGMIGVRTSGGVTLEPEHDQASNAFPVYPLAPLSQNVETTPLTGSKIVKIPAGVATTFQLQMRRNTTAATPSINYSLLSAAPIGRA